MIQHFSFKPLFKHQQLPSWSVSFFYKQKHYEAIYEQDGTVKWVDQTPPDEDDVKKMIHELMLFHVYD